MNRINCVILTSTQDESSERLKRRKNCGPPERSRAVSTLALSVSVVVLSALASLALSFPVRKFLRMAPTALVPLVVSCAILGFLAKRAYERGYPSIISPVDNIGVTARGGPAPLCLSNPRRL